MIFCTPRTCSEQDPVHADGRRICNTCGRPVPDERDRMLAWISRRQQEILDRLDGLEAGQPNAEPSLRLLTTAELASAMGRSPRWVQEHADELGATRLGEGPKARLYFNPATVQQRLGGEPLASPAPAAPRPRSRRRASGRDLLPIRGEKAA